jgi:glycogen operon protein
MHVDGFRFDLAPALTRGRVGEPHGGPFLATIAQDPVLSRVKLIAEPWDIGPGGYQVGQFPIGWAEWNDKYRDTIRRFWRGDPGQIADVGYRLTGSSDLFDHAGRRPSASINFVTAHDGFTLRDLVSYNAKHNLANGEGNRDGHNDNHSANYGAEGPTADPALRALRNQQIRNFLTTIALSQGVPMFLHGDEIGRTQGGNNNAYCQDNAIAWQPWELDDEARALLAWTKRVLALRREHPLLRRRDYFHYRPLGSTPPPDILWLDTDGSELSEQAWRSPQTRALGIWLNSQGVDTRDLAGHPEHDEALLLLFNAGEQAIDFAIPRHDPTGWLFVLDSARPDQPAGAVWDRPTYPLAARAVTILRQSRTMPAPHAQTASASPD